MTISKHRFKFNFSSINTFFAFLFVLLNNQTTKNIFGWENVKWINQVLLIGETTDDAVLETSNLDKIIYVWNRYATIILVDVEKSFSLRKNVLTTYRLRFSDNNLSKYMTVNLHKN